MKAIPTGKTKNAVDVRREFLKKELSKLKDKKYRCPCLGGVPVKIIGDSIDEIAAHAAKSFASTKAALQLPKLINEARFFKMYLPKDNYSQKKKFKFIFIYELHCPKEKGFTKIMVGVRESGKFLQYCITEQ